MYVCIYVCIYIFYRTRTPYTLGTVYITTVQFNSIRFNVHIQNPVPTDPLADDIATASSGPAITRNTTYYLRPTTYIAEVCAEASVDINTTVRINNTSARS